ncbi:MAG: BamA/TamA family outer membrane protein [Endomicrobia bacterium]|nr:BamA/TamA family outer membrane protein [Endomicrobiia bacterium]MCL2506738.1 BamA/TamA family outer membrane protein [Endomicrobiia bacterium]
MKNYAVVFIIISLFCMPAAQTASYAQSSVPSERLQESISEYERRQALEELVEQRKKEEIEKQEKIREDAQTIGLDNESDKDSNDKKAVFLKEIRFSRSAVLPQSFFDSLREKYENTWASLNDIYAIVNAINNEYMLKGYIASQAYLTEQDITTGNLFVSLMEGIVDKVNVKGNKTTSEKYIRRYVTFNDNVDNFNAKVTNQEILDFNAANDAKVRITLSPGEVFGTSDVDLIVDEPNRYSLGIFVDNSGQEETGLIRYGAYTTVRSLTRYRDIFNLGGVFSDGSKAMYVSYEIPEPFFGMRVGAGFDYSDTEIVNGGLRTLNVTGNYYSAYIFAKRPFLVRENTTTNVNFTATTKKGASYISNFMTQDTKTDTLAVTGDNTLLTTFGYLYNMLSYTQGLKMIEGQTNFEKISYYGEAYCGLPYNFGINAKLRATAAFDTVPSSEQFSIGGMNTVRGYREGMLMAKNGAAANAELNYDIKFIKYKYIDFTRVFGFFDYGVIFPDNEFDFYPDFEKMIYSTGFGIKIGILKYIDANVVWAIPLVDHNYFEVPGSKVLFIVQGRI